MSLRLQLGLLISYIQCILFFKLKCKWIKLFFFVYISLASDAKFSYFKKLNGAQIGQSEPSTPTTPSLSSSAAIPVNLLSNENLHVVNTSASLASIPNTALTTENAKKMTRSHSEDAKKTDQTKLYDTNGNRANVINENNVSGVNGVNGGDGDITVIQALSKNMHNSITSGLS